MSINSHNISWGITPSTPTPASPVIMENKAPASPVRPRVISLKPHIFPAVLCNVPVADPEKHRHLLLRDDWFYNQ